MRWPSAGRRFEAAPMLADALPAAAADQSPPVRNPAIIRTRRGVFDEATLAGVDVALAAADAVADPCHAVPAERAEIIARSVT